MFTHLVRRPQAPVSDFVDLMWSIQARHLHPQRTLLLPDGAFVLMVNFGDPQGVCDRATLRRTQSFSHGWISGTQLEPLLIEEGGRCDFVGIRFRAGGAFALFREEIAALTGHVVEFEAVAGAAARALREELGDRADPAERLTRLEAWLAGRLRDATPDPRVGWVAERLSAAAGERTIGAMSSALGISHKHLIAQFKSRVGVTPGWFARVQRFQRLLQHVGLQPAVNWADCAFATGYSDQSHLINEFRDLSGLTPTVFLERRSPYVGYLTAP